MEQPILAESQTTHQFNNHKWRNITVQTEEILSDYKLKGVISPFGFETLKNKKFLSGRLRKFYVYIGVDTNTKNIDLIARDFREQLFRQLEKDMPEFLSDVVAIIENRNITTLNAENYTCKTTDTLIDIQVRKINSNKTIIDDYVDYLICTIDAVLNQKGEAGYITHSSIMRSRMFQLYLMLESIFKKYLPPLDQKDLLYFKNIPKFISNRIDVFFNDGLSVSEISSQESFIYQNLILKRLRLLQDNIKPTASSFIKKLKIDSYHHPSKLSTTLDEKIYTDVKNLIVNSYRGCI